MNYMTISLQELQEIFRLIRGAKIISMTCITEPKLRKGAPENIVKVTRLNGIINCNYGNVVNNARERENKERDFVPEPRKWGARLPGLPLVSWVNKDGSHNLFLEIIVKKVISVEYRQWGKVIPLKDIENYIIPSNSNKNHQQLDKEIVLRDYNVKNIITIDIDGCGYILRH